MFSSPSIGKAHLIVLLCCQAGPLTCIDRFYIVANGLLRMCNLLKYILCTPYIAMYSDRLASASGGFASARQDDVHAHDVKQRSLPWRQKNPRIKFVPWSMLRRTPHSCSKRAALPLVVGSGTIVPSFLPRKPIRGGTSGDRLADSRVGWE